MQRHELHLPLRDPNKRNSFATILMMLVRFGVLGIIDAALGRKDEALNEGRRAVELRCFQWKRIQPTVSA